MFLFIFIFSSQGFAIPHANQRSFGSYTIIGQNASIKEYPSLVGLRGDGKRCTGTLITRNFILTAAHCLRSPLTSAYIGNTVITDGDLHHLRKEDFFQHPGFSGNISERTDDIALIRIPTPVGLSQSVAIAKMAEKDDVFKVGTICKMAGWGSLNQYEHVGTDILHEAEMKLTDAEECARKGTINSETEFCFTAIPELDEITAKGDSGTSLWCKKEGNDHYLVSGVDSRGKDDNTIFTKVSHYRDWIDEILASHHYLLRKKKRKKFTA